MNVEMKKDYIRSAIKNADAWHLKGEFARVASCLNGALMTATSVAVGEHLVASNAVSWLREGGIDGILGRYLDVTKALASQVDSGRMPSSVIADSFGYLICAHLAWALDQVEQGETYVGLAGRRDVLKLTTPFWREYVRGMESLVRREPYEPQFVKCRGQEKYWTVYLNLMRCATQGAGLGEAIREVDAAFLRRNSDGRITDDSYETEGSGLHPVRWDYRRDSLLSYAARYVAIS